MRRAKGSITEKEPGVWLCQITLQGQYTAGGSPKRRSETIRGTRKDAEAHLAIMNVLSGNAPECEVPYRTFLEEGYLVWAKGRVREQTYRNYEQYARKLMAAPWATASVAHIPKMSQTVETWLMSEKKPGARLDMFKVFRMSMNFAVKHHMADFNPSAAMDIPTLEPKKKTVVESANAASYMWIVRDTGIEAGILIALWSGARRSEVCALDFGTTVDLSKRGDGWHGLVSITHGIHERSKNDLYVEPPKSLNSARTVKLPESIGNRLEELSMSAVAVETDDGTRVYPIMTDSGARMSPDTFSRRWKKLWRAANGERRSIGMDELPWVTVKNLRHSCGTMLVREAGASVEDVQQQLGHSSTQVTEGFYIQESDSVTDRNAARLNGLV